MSSLSVGAAFSSVSGFAAAFGFSTIAGFSAGADFALDEDFSLLDALALAVDFSLLDALALADDFSVLGAFAAVDGFSVVVFGFVATDPFDAEAVPFVAGVVLGDDADFSVRFLAVDVEAVAVSATDLGAVSGFTAGAHAQAMTIAISGRRARPVISSLVEGY